MESLIFIAYSYARLRGGLERIRLSGCSNGGGLVRSSPAHKWRRLHHDRPGVPRRGLGCWRIMIISIFMR